MSWVGVRAGVDVVVRRVKARAGMDIVVRRVEARKSGDCGDLMVVDGVCGSFKNASDESSSATSYSYG